jgi:hypothetical protein
MVKRNRKREEVRKTQKKKQIKGKQIREGREKN